MGRATVRVGIVLTAAALVAGGFISSALAPVKRLDLPSAPSRATAASATRSETPVPGPKWSFGTSPLAKAPSVSGSLYVSTTNTGRLQDMGCRGGQAAIRGSFGDMLVLLDFGRPARSRSHEGVALIRGGFRRIDDVREAVLSYAEGFLRCTAGRPRTHLTLAVGTSNWGPHITYLHGVRWAQLVNAANDQVQQQGQGGRVTVFGANDIELSWNSPRVTRRWVAGYDSVGRWPYLDYGDAGGCPPYGRCLGAWTLDDVWWVAWGARSAFPLPEIYTNSSSQARQWYRLSLYSYLRYGKPMTIVGVLSQRKACRQAKNDPCAGMSNTPYRAWVQLSRLLNADGRTRQALRWSTDIGYDR